MPELVDWLDTLLIGAFLFGLLLAVSTALLGGLHLDGHGGHADSHGWLPFSLTGGLVFLTWLGGLGYLFRRGLDWPAPVAVVVAAVAGFALAAAVQRLLALLSRSEDGGLDPARTRVVGSLGVPGSTPTSCSSSGAPATIALAASTPMAPVAATPSTAPTSVAMFDGSRLAWALPREVSEYTSPSAGSDSIAPVKARSSASDRLDRKMIRKTNRATAAVSRPKRSFARLSSVNARFTHRV